MATMAVSKEAVPTGVWSRAWEMVEERNPTADKLFVYAVRTTGVYCRPTCPSRRPLRGSVEFFATGELARAAVRAVARACASNPVAVVIPCHRVVGSDGRLTRYRWGVVRKRQLLNLESQRFSGTGDRADRYGSLPTESTAE